MVNIILKDINGDDVLYSGIEKISVRNDVGESFIINIPKNNEEAVELVLPQQFANSSQIYTFITDDYVFVSSNAINVGLWKYDIKSETLEQVFNTGDSWLFAQQQTIDGDWLVTGSNTLNHGGSGLLLIRGNDFSVTNLLEGVIDPYFITRNWEIFHPLASGDILVASRLNGGYGLLLYKHTTKNVVALSTAGTGRLTFHDLDDNHVLVSGYGIELFDNTTDTLSTAYPATSGDSSPTSNFVDAGDGYVLIGRDNNSYGILLYDPNSKTCTKIWTSGQYWLNWSSYIKLDNGDILIGSTSTASSSSGFLIYYSSSKTIQKIYANSNNWRKFYKLSNGNCLCSSETANSGLVLFDSSTNSATQIYSSDYGFYKFTEVRGGDVIISRTMYNSGLYLYENDTNSVRKIYSDNSTWANRILLESGNCLISGTSSTTTTAGYGLILYNVDTKTASKIVNNGDGPWSVAKIADSTYLLSSGKNMGLYIYDDSTLTATEISSVAGSYEFSFIDNKWFAINTIKNITFVLNEDGRSVSLYSAKLDI